MAAWGLGWAVLYVFRAYEYDEDRPSRLLVWVALRGPLLAGRRISSDDEERTGKLTWPVGPVGGWVVNVLVALGIGAVGLPTGVTFFVPLGLAVGVANGVVERVNEWLDSGEPR